MLICAGAFFHMKPSLSSLLSGHDDEILDVCFNSTGSLLTSASADGVILSAMFLTHQMNKHLVRAYSFPLPFQLITNVPFLLPFSFSLFLALQEVDVYTTL